MEIFIKLVTLLWICAGAGSLASFLVTIFDDEYDKRDVVKALSHALVGTTTAIALYLS